MDLELKIQIIIKKIESEIIHIPKEINNIKSKGINIFIYSLQKVLFSLKPPILNIELSEYNKFIAIINDSIEIINNIDYILEEQILNNQFLSQDIINYIYMIRLEYCNLNNEILKTKKLLLNNDILIEHINTLNKIILNINNIAIIELLTKEIKNNFEKLKILDYKIIIESIKKLSLINEFLEKKIVDNNLLLKLLNLIVNTNGNITKILAYFTLFLSIITINETNERFKNICKNILLHLNNFAININIKYLMNEIIGNIIYEYNNSIV